MAGTLKLSGGDAEHDLEFRKSEVEHLRRLLAWVSTEFMLDEHAQAGVTDALKQALSQGLADETDIQAVAKQADARIQQVPKYVQNAIKMLQKMLAAHDRRGDTVDAEVVAARITDNG